MTTQIFRAAILNPEPTGRIRFLRDGALVGDEAGRIAFVGEWAELHHQFGSSQVPVTRLTGILCPAFLDAHIHIPQYPIRGRFAEGVEEEADGGRLLAGLNRNVFPAEAKCSDETYAADCVRQFRDGTLSQGVVGGCAYMTVHARATEVALRDLGPAWSVGMVLMNQNCPEYLRTDEGNLDRDIRHLASRFGRRFIVTDRFAVAVSTELRSKAAKLAGELRLRMQTHLNEQQSEKKLVETRLYPNCGTYTRVYANDGLLDRQPILAHCVWMQPAEWAMARDSGSAVAHCPTSNSVLGSGVMDLEEVRRRGIPYAICTDVGASPTTSMLCEMAEFLAVHHGRHASGTAEEALYRSTLAPARILEMDHHLGSFEPGKAMTFVEIAPAGELSDTSAEDVIRRHLLELPQSGWPAHADLRGRLAESGLSSPRDMDVLAADAARTVSRLGEKVRTVIIDGHIAWRRSTA